MAREDRRRRRPAPPRSRRGSAAARPRRAHAARLRRQRRIGGIDADGGASIAADAARPGASQRRRRAGDRSRCTGPNGGGERQRRWRAAPSRPRPPPRSRSCALTSGRSRAAGRRSGACSARGASARRRPTATMSGTRSCAASAMPLTALARPGPSVVTSRPGRAADQRRPPAAIDGRRRLVAGEHEADAGRLQRVDERHDLAAGHAEGLAHADRRAKRARRRLGHPRRAVRRGPRSSRRSGLRVRGSHGAPTRSSRSFTTSADHQAKQHVAAERGPGERDEVEEGRQSGDEMRHHVEGENPQADAEAERRPSHHGRNGVARCQRPGDEEVADRIEQETDDEMDDFSQRAGSRGRTRDLHQRGRLERPADSRQERRDQPGPDLPGQIGGDAGEKGGRRASPR